MSSRLLVLLGSVALLIATGCSGPRPLADRPALPGTFPNHTVDQVQAALRPAPFDTLASYRGKASLAIRTPQQSASLTADLRHRRADSLYMSLSPGLGIEAARVLVTPDSFFVYDRLKKRLTYGPASLADEYLPGPLSNDDLFLGLIGLAGPELSTPWALEADSSHYILRDPARDRFYVIDPSIWRVTQYEERDEAGNLVEQRLYEDYDLIDGLFVPRRVVLRRPQDESSATLYYRDLDLTPGPLTFSFRISSEAERVLVDGDSGQRTSGE